LRLNLTANFQPLDRVGATFAIGAGRVEQEDAASKVEQTVRLRKIGLNLNLAEFFFMNFEVRHETYTGGTYETGAVFSNGFLTYLPRQWAKLTYRKYSTALSGSVYTLSSSGLRNQDTNDLALGISLPYNFYLDGGLIFAALDTNRYKTEKAALKFKPASLAAFEIKRERKTGTEASQNIDNQADSLRVDITLGRLSFKAETSWLLTRAAADLYGFKNNYEVNYLLGDSSFKAVMNAERKDQNSSVYTRGYYSFARNF
jgi:hypothetical protein